MESQSEATPMRFETIANPDMLRKSIWKGRGKNKI